MSNEERRVVTDSPDTVTTGPVTTERVVETTPVTERVVEPTTVVERPATRIVQSDDVVGNVWAASQLIQTIVWSVVVIVLLVVLLLALHTYAHLF